MKKHIILAFKGFSMGITNVIPGVSGGTIALITGIFEDIITSIKSFNITALTLIMKGKFKEFAEHVNLWFLLTVFGGAILGVISFARVLDFLFVNYPIFTWSFFFGLIIASVFFVCKTIERWNVPVVMLFIVGTTVALVISFLNPAVENDNFFYLILCGVVAICSMILPGLSGSFVLIIMGNYQLIMIDAVTTLNISILAPVAIGAVGGLLAFSYILSWLFKTFKNQTIALLAGFILGSLLLLWPWKKSVDLNAGELLVNKFGAFVSESGQILENVKVIATQQIIPEIDTIFFVSIACMLLGIVTIYCIEKIARKV